MRFAVGLTTEQRRTDFGMAGRHATALANECGEAWHTERNVTRRIDPIVKRVLVCVVTEAEDRGRLHAVACRSEIGGLLLDLPN